MVRAMKRLAIVAMLGACGGGSSEPPSIATGELGEWRAGPALPVPRANHCSAALRVGDQDWVVVAGGNAKIGDSFVATDEIDAAPLAADGTLGPWVVAGHAPSAVTECTAAADGATLYLVDGLYENEADRGKVLRGTLDESGSIAVSAMGDLPAGVVTISSEADVQDGALYVMHSELPADGDATLTLHTPIDAIGWDMADWGIGFRAQAEYAFTHGNIFAIGGYGGDDANTVLTDVIMATTDGEVVLPSPSLPAPVAFGEAAAVDDYLFVVGGRDSVFGAGGSTTVYVSAIGHDWTTATPLPVPRTNHDMVLAGDYLVLTGGADTAGGDTTVLVAQVRFPQ